MIVLIFLISYLLYNYIIISLKFLLFKPLLLINSSVLKQLNVVFLVHQSRRFLPEPAEATNVANSGPQCV